MLRSTVALINGSSLSVATAVALAVAVTVGLESACIAQHTAGSSQPSGKPGRAIASLPKVCSSNAHRYQASPTPAAPHIGPRAAATALMVTSLADSAASGTLRTAIQRTNASPGVYAITFDPSLAGGTIRLQSPLPALSTGSVYLDGDTAGDGKPHITIQGPAGGPAALRIASGGNTIRGLMIRGFLTGIAIDSASKGARYDENTVVGVDVAADWRAIDFSPYLRVPQTAEGDTWAGLNIVDSTLEAKWGVLIVTVMTASTLESLTVIGNTIIQDGPGNTGFGVNIDAGQSVSGDGNRISDVTVAGNQITSNGLEALRIGSGSGGASHNTIQDVEVIDNQIETQPGAYGQGKARDGIGVVAGDGGTDDQDPGYRPVIWPESNQISNVKVLGNTISGQGGSGLVIQGGIGGAKDDHIFDVDIEGNKINGSEPRTGGRGDGIMIAGADSGNFYGRISTGNLVSNITIRANELAETTQQHGWPAPIGGIVIVGGVQAQSNKIDGVILDGNSIDSTELSVSVIGGWSQQGPYAASNNSVSGVSIVCTTAASADPLRLRMELSGIAIIGGYGNSQSNSTEVIVANNLVGRRLGGVTTEADVSGANEDATGPSAIASGNSISVAAK